MRSIAAAKIPQMIFKRNKELRGTLRPIKCKHYADTDTIAKGTSKKDWRLLHLEADDVFLKSLERFPEDHLFKLGANGITIKGGQGRSSTTRNRERRRSRKSGLGKETVSKILEKVSEELFSEREREERAMYEDVSKNKKDKRAQKTPP